MLQRRIEKYKLKILYALLFLVLSSSGRFTTVFFEEKGLDGSHIGLITSVALLLSFVVGPLWAGWADRLSKPRTVLLVELVLGAVAFLLLAIPTGKYTSDSSAAFVWTFIAYTIYVGCTCGQLPLADTLCLLHLNNNRHLYGKQRLWGAISWGLWNVVLGVCLDYVGTSMMFVSYLTHAVLIVGFLFFFVTERPLTGNPTLNAEATGEYAELHQQHQQQDPCNDAKATTDVVADIISSNDHKSEGAEQQQPQEHAKKVSFRSVLSILVQTPRITVFFVYIFVISMGVSFVENLLFLYLARHFEATRFLMGLSVMVTVSVEIPIFQVSSFLLTKFGETGLIVVASASYILRVVGYSLISDAWLVLLLEPFHGITYGCLQTATISYTAALTANSPHLKASVQGLVSSSRSLGNALGAIVGGLVMDHFGAVVLYRFAGVLVLGAVCLFVASVKAKRCSRPYACCCRYDTEPNSPPGLDIQLVTASSLAASES